MVIAILANPVNSDPIGALFATRVKHLRWLVRDSVDARANFVRQYRGRRNALDTNVDVKEGRIQGPPLRLVDGPVSGICEAAHWYMCDLEVTEGDVTFRTVDGLGLAMRNSHHTDFKRQLVEITRQGILHGLKIRVAGVGGGKPPKDMGGVSHVINLPATLANLRSRKKAPVPGIDRHFSHQIIMSILTGSIRAAG